MHFLSIHAHRSGRADAWANRVPLNGGHDDPDVLVNHDLFTDTPTKNQHGFPSLIVGKTHRAWSGWPRHAGPTLH
jgi:hypothetical protein